MSNSTDIIHQWAKYHDTVPICIFISKQEYDLDRS